MLCKLLLTHTHTHAYTHTHMHTPCHAKCSCGEEGPKTGGKLSTALQTSRCSPPPPPSPHPPRCLRRYRGVELISLYDRGSGSAEAYEVGDPFEEVGLHTYLTQILKSQCPSIYSLYIKSPYRRLSRMGSLPHKHDTNCHKSVP